MVNAAENITSAQTTKSELKNSSELKLGGPMAWWVWTLSVLFVVYLFSFQTGYAVVNGRVQGELGLTIGQVGSIAALYTWAFALCQFFGGALLDRVGARAVLPISIAMVTAGIFIFANASNYEMLLVSQVIIAIGSCTGFVGAGYIGGQWFGMAKFSFMFGLVQLVASLTSAFSQPLIDLSLKHITWRYLFNATGIFGILLCILGAFYIKNPKPVEIKNSGDGGFFISVFRSLIEVAKIPHVWIASIIGAATFGVMLALGVVWMPKLLKVHGLAETTANIGTAMLWLGLAVGSACVPHWSDIFRSRKMPIIVGGAVQLVVLLALLYVPLDATVCLALAFVFGFANAAHMLSFSTAADVVEPRLIGTSAAVVNGIMFILGGVLMSRPGVRIGWGLDQGIQGASLELAQFAGRPAVLALITALVLSFVMKETYPKKD